MSEDDLGNQQLEQLAGKPVDTSPQDKQLATDLQQEAVKQAKQANRQREVLFRVANTLAGAAVLTSIIMVIAVLCGAQIVPAVAIAFISGLTLETLGILAIVARYLYPSSGDRDQ